jgi:hypothetical protein
MRGEYSFAVRKDARLSECDEERLPTPLRLGVLRGAVLRVVVRRPADELAEALCA